MGIYRVRGNRRTLEKMHKKVEAGISPQTGNPKNIVQGGSKDLGRYIILQTYAYYVIGTSQLIPFNNNIEHPPTPNLKHSHETLHIGEHAQYYESEAFHALRLYWILKNSGDTLSSLPVSTCRTGFEATNMHLQCIKGLGLGLRVLSIQLLEPSILNSRP